MNKIFPNFRTDFKTRTMKKILLPFFLFVCVSFYSDAQNKISNTPPPQPPKSAELILYMPHVDKLKTLQTVIDIVQSTKDIKAVAFCDDLKCLLLRVEGDHPEKSERLLNDLKIAGIDFDIKSNATIQQVLNASHDILNEKSYWQ